MKKLQHQEAKATMTRLHYDVIPARYALHNGQDPVRSSAGDNFAPPTSGSWHSTPGEKGTSRPVSWKARSFPVRLLPAAIPQVTKLRLRGPASGQPKNGFPKHFGTDPPSYLPPGSSRLFPGQLANGFAVPRINLKAITGWGYRK